MNIVKGLIALFFIWSVGYGAADKAELQKTLQANKIQGNIVSSSDLGSGLSMVIVEVNNQQAPFLATDDGKMIFQAEVLIAQDKSTESRVQEFYKNLYEKENHDRNTRRNRTVLDCSIRSGCQTATQRTEKHCRMLQGQ